MDDDGHYVVRNGKSTLGDEAFLAWNSGDLTRMLAATACKTNPIDRHYLLLSIVQATYKQRGIPRMRDLCVKWGRQHLEELPQLRGPLRKDMGGTMPNVPTLDLVRRALLEVGDAEQAKEVARIGRKPRASP
jgi:hypothetical protein